MKKIFLLFAFATIAFVSSCSSDGSSGKSNNVFKTLKVLRWGPTEAKIGTIENKQPDGKMGIWIDVPSTEGIGEVQVLFDGHPEVTAIEPKLITAGVSPEELTVAGDKKIEIKSVPTGETLPVGTFKLTP